MPKIKISGVIIPNDYQEIYDWLGWDATSPNKVARQINDANNGELEVEINSGGGSVFAGSEIYTALKSYEGNVVGKIVGIAASAASVIAMGCNKLLMSPTSQMMIHNATLETHGDYREMDHTSIFLKNVNQTIANAYKIKSGKNDDEILSLMDDETWFTPQQALENNLIDEIMFQDNMQVVASHDSGLLPIDVVNKIKNEILKDKNKPNNDINPPNNKADFLMAKLNLLKLKGDMTNDN